MKPRSDVRQSRLLPALLLAVALCTPALPAHAQEAEPEGNAGAASSEDAANEAYDEPLAEELLNEEGEAQELLEPEETERRRDGATARRELLFRDGLDERERRYPRGLEPLPPIERSDLRAFDARVRGRDAEVLTDAPPGLTISGSISAGLQIDDNPLLESSEETLGEDTGAWGYVVEPRVTVTRRTPVSLFQGILRLPYDDLNYFDESRSDDLGSFDQYAGLQYDLVGRETAINMFANIANTTTRIALVEDTGAGLSGNRALTYGGGGSIKHAVTANSVLQFSADVRRQSINQADLDDSTTYQIAGDYRTLLTASDTIGLGVAFQQFLPSGLGTIQADVVTALASWSRRVRASLTFDVEAGAQIISSDDVGDTFDDGTRVAPYAEASLYWAAGNKDSVAFIIGHSADPSATGDIRATTRIELEYRRELTRELSFGMPFLVLFQDDALENDFENRTFFQVAPNLAWTWGPSWGMAFEYRFRLDKETGLSTATSNAAFLTVGYFGRLFP